MREVCHLYSVGDAFRKQKQVIPSFLEIVSRVSLLIDVALQRGWAESVHERRPLPDTRASAPGLRKTKADVSRVT